MYSLSELQRSVADYMRGLDVDGNPHSLYEPIAYSLAAGGKRLRPMLTVLSCNIFSDNALSALPAAAALEVFHTFTLLHDDVMDNATVRRGKPSVYGKWGTNAALLSGDAMMIYSYKLLQQTPVEYLPAVLGCFNYTAMTVCEGQQMDMEFERRNDVTLEEYMAMIDKKTAALLAGATMIAYSLAAGGKRLRPMLTVLSCNIFSDNALSALPAAAALEVFHTFTLLHDDVMDNATVRRGKPSVYGKWGTNAALLSGDAMMIYSYKLLQQTPVEYLPAVLGCFNYTAMTVCEGQQMDMEFERRNDVTLEEYMAMIDKKTAALLAGATMIGAIQGGADTLSRRHLFSFATELGVAFQLQDDLLDAYGTEAQLGKPIGGDIIEGKKSFLMITAFDRADAAVRKQLHSLLEEKSMASDEKITRVLAIYDQLGVREIAEREIEAHFSRAMDALSCLEVEPERVEPLRALAQSLLGRNK